MLNYYRNKNKGTYRSGEGGEMPAICDPVSELLLGGRARVVRGEKMGSRKKKEKEQAMERSDSAATSSLRILRSAVSGLSSR